MTRLRFGFGMLLLAVFMLGCDGRDGALTAQESFVNEQDSSGVQLLEVDWRGMIDRSEVGTLPVTQVIGSIDAPGILLHGVVGVVPAGENRWVIGQSQAPYLLLVSGQELIASAGRHGEGPGEFRRLDWVGATPDGRIAAHSGLDQKLASFAPDLTFTDERRLDPESWSGLGYLAALSIEGVTGDGTFVGSAMRRGPGDGRVPVGWSRPERGLLALDPDGSVRPVPGAIRGDELYGWESECPTSVPGPCRGFNDRPPLQKRGAVRVVEDRLYVLDTGDGVVEVRDASGSPGLRLRFPTSWPEPTADQIGRAVAAHMAAINSTSEAIARNVREQAAPGPPPVLRTFAVGAPDELWVQLDEVVVPEAEELLVRVDTSDPTAAAYRVPPGFSLLGANERRVWGVVTDELDVEYVYVLELPR